MTWATSVPILVFLGLYVLDLRSDVRDRQADVRRASSLNAPPPALGAGHNNMSKHVLYILKLAIGLIAEITVKVP